MFLWICLSYGRPVDIGFKELGCYCSEKEIFPHLLVMVFSIHDFANMSDFVKSSET